MCGKNVTLIMSIMSKALKGTYFILGSLEMKGYFYQRICNYRRLLSCFGL